MTFQENTGFINNPLSELNLSDADLINYRLVIYWLILQYAIQAKYSRNINMTPCKIEYFPNIWKSIEQ